MKASKPSYSYNTFEDLLEKAGVIIYTNVGFNNVKCFVVRTTV